MKKLKVMLYVSFVYVSYPTCSHVHLCTYVDYTDLVADT